MDAMDISKSLQNLSKFKLLLRLQPNFLSDLGVALLDDIPVSPSSRRLAAAPAALGTRPIVLSPRAARHEWPQSASNF
jgi:hypothetical protein